MSIPWIILNNSVFCLTNDATSDACGVCNGNETDPNNCYDNTTLWISNVIVDEEVDFPECLQDCEGWEYWIDANAEDKILTAPIINLEQLEPSYENLEIEKSIYLGGKKILDNTCITISGNLVNKDKFFNIQCKYLNR